MNLKNMMAATGAALATALLLSTPASAASPADNYPAKPVKVLVGYAAGGSTDVVARLISQKLSVQMGQQFIVENKAGANGNIAAEMVARAVPDGLTIYLGAINNAINASLYAKLPFEFIRDFAPISLLATVPNILVVHPSVPARNVSELIALAKSRPGEINFASAGSGSSIHMSGELFKMIAGVDMIHIPYKGSAPAVADLLGGRVQTMFDNAPSALPHVRTGKLRALAVTSASRAPAAPELPTMIESGLGGYEVTSWFALFAPAGTHKDIIEKLNVEVNKALNSPDVKESLAKLGATTAGTSPQELGTFLANETSKWAKVVKASGAKVD